MSVLLRYMVSFCHKCGATERFSMTLRPISKSSYLLMFKCPVCGYNNEVVASKEDLDSLYKPEVRQDENN